MTAAEQQQQFENTRARIQANLNEITEFSRTCLNPREYFAHFLKLLVDSLSAKGGAVWFQRGDAFGRIAENDFASSQYEENPAQRGAIDRLLVETAKTRRPYAVPAAQQAAPESQVTNTTPYPYFYAPISDDKNLLVLQVWLREAGDPRTYHDISAFLTSWSSHALVFLRNHQRALFAAKNEELATLVNMQSVLLGELNPSEVKNVLVNYGSDLFKADLAGLFQRQGKNWRLIAASNQEVVDDKSQQTRKLSALVKNLEIGEKAKAASVTTDEALKEQLEGIGYAHVLWKTFKSPHKHADFLIAAFRHQGSLFGQEACDLLDRFSEAAGKSIDTAFHYHALPFRWFLGKVARAVTEWRAHRRKKFAVLAIVLAVLAVILLLIPVPLKVTADCTIDPTHKAVAVSESAGKISKVFVREGQEVKPGDPLAQLDDQDYLTQIAVSKQTQLRWEVEAARAQTAGSEAERKLAEVSAQREVENIKRLEYLRSKTLIRSPMAGVVLSKNLQNREGEPIEVGTPFCEIAGKSDFQVVLEVKQNDIGDVLNSLKAKGDLPFDFILHSYPKTHFTADIDNLDRISQLPDIRKDHSFYLVKVPFPKDSPLEDLLKPGYTGKAKVRLGTSNLLYSWFRPFLNYWRVEWGV
jgi:biotin carboxyl carrier protein